MSIEVREVSVESRGTKSTFAIDDAQFAAARDALKGRTVWHVNTTAQGGGVAELLYNTIRHHRAAGINARWLVVSAEQPFFEVTKQLHHLFHGSAGSGLSLDDEQRAIYSKVTDMQADMASLFVRPNDVVVLHDPQPLGMAPRLKRLGARVLWRSHIGTSTWNDPVERGWDFLRPFLDVPERYAVSSMSYAPPFLDTSRVDVIYPSINVQSTKCAEMDNATVHTTLGAVGLEADDGAPERDDLSSMVRIIQDETLPAGAPLLLQLSRWDPLKDMEGVMRAFGSGIATNTDAHLVLAGPDPDDIPDDPENASVLQRVLTARDHLAPEVRKRTHLAIISLRDIERNAVIVNALQRRATVISQKSLQEGFGLAVTEAMWKRRPVVASAVGGIAEQVEDGVHGLLIDDPRDLDAYSAAVVRLFSDATLRDRLVEAAYERCQANFLIGSEMSAYVKFYNRALASE